MKALTYVEIDIPVCQLSFGTAPCTATGDKKCFNGRATCLDLPNIDEETVTLRFVKDCGYQPIEIEAIPSLLQLSLSPATIKPGESLGERASCNATFADHYYSDTATGIDKYFAERDYDPYKRGTFWGKFRARQPFIRGKRMRVIRGYLPASFSAEFPFGQPLPAGVLDRQDVRHYVIENFDGAKPDGTFAISARDILKLADGDRAQAPVASGGRLLNPIEAADTTCALAPAGVANEEYSTSGYVNLGGKEIAFFARDPYEGLNSDTKLLLHADGANNATSTTDASSIGHTPIFGGNAKLSTTNKKWGTASLLFDGSGDYVYFNDHAAFHLGTSNFTVDCWIRPAAIGSDQAIVTYGSNNTTDYWQLRVKADGTISFHLRVSNVETFTFASAAGLIVEEEFQHVALVRDGTEFTIYLNGAAVASATSSVSLPNRTYLILGIGGDFSSRPFNGNIDEFRLQATAFWTDEFEDELPGPYAASPDTLILTRGQLNTTAQSHAAQDRVQLVLSYFGKNVADIVFDLLTGYANTDEEFIPYENWQTEVGLYHNQVYTTHIAEPTPVKTLLDELMKQAQLAIWQDDASQKIQLRVLRPVPSTSPLISDDSYLLGTFQSREQLDRRKSRVWTFFAQRSPLAKIDDTDNYRSSDLVFNAESEVNYETPSIEKIFSRWIPEGGRAVASKLGDIILSRLAKPPRKFNFSLWKDYEPVPQLGGMYFLSAPTLQDDTGEQTQVPVIITRLDPNDTTYEIEAEEANGGAVPVDLVNRLLPIESDTYNINVRTLHDSIYQPLTDEDVTNGVNLTIRINAGVVVGSVSNLLPSIDFGDDEDWPEDFEIMLEIYGLVAGKGGDACGNYNKAAGTIYPPVNFPPKPGGTALLTRFPIKVRVKPGGKMGGGGGAGGPAAVSGGLTGVGSIPGAGAGRDPGAAAIVGGNPGTDLEGGSQVPVSGQLNSGKGGDIGEPGQDGGNYAGSAQTTTGAVAGNAIDGVSFCTILEGDADILGPRVN